MMLYLLESQLPWVFGFCLVMMEGEQESPLGQFFAKYVGMISLVGKHVCNYLKPRNKFRFLDTGKVFPVTVDLKKEFRKSHDFYFSVSKYFYTMYREGHKLIPRLTMPCVLKGKDELEQMLPSIEAFAKAAGIKRLYGGGRKGWIRKIKHLGFETEYLIRKDL